MATPTAGSQTNTTTPFNQVNVSAIDCAKNDLCFRPILPVRVKFEDGRSTEVYCLIDTGSNKTVITKAFQRRYSLKTSQQWITLNGLGATSSCLRDVGSIALQSIEDEDFSISNVEVYVVDSIPADSTHIARRRHLDGHPHLNQVKLNELPVNEIDLLIGTDLAHSFAPDQVIKGANSSLIAIHCPLGYALMGPSGLRGEVAAWAAFATFEESEGQRLDDQLLRMFRHDFPELPSEKKGPSQEDQRAMAILEKTTKFVDGHFQTGLLWKHDRATTASLLNTDASEVTARSRTLKMIKRLAKTPGLKEKVENRIQDLIESKFAEVVPTPNHKSDITWYLPSVVVVHENKEKPRFCLDCRAETHGVSLNSVLLTGTGEMKTVYSALQNTRLFDYLAVGDIKDFFHKVAIAEEDKDAQRFFRWIPGRDDELECLRMTCNMFGAACSSTNAAHAFRKNAEVNGKGFSDEVIKAVDGAYVDDVPVCAPSEKELIALVHGLIDMCKMGDFTLTKFFSNSRALLESLPEEARAKDFKDPNLPFPTASVLGVKYNPGGDTFSVKDSSEKVGGGSSPKNRKQLLSAVMSVWDPLGIGSPFVLIGKKLNQRLCFLKLPWDAPLPDDIQAEVDKWYSQICKLSSITIPRSFSLLTSTQPCTLHTFTDASWIAYAAVGFYVVDGTDQVHWISSRSRVSPNHDPDVDVSGSTPRIELQGAVAGVELATQIQEEINVTVSRKFFHTDSTTVFWWIQNREEKYPVFVANRLNKIHLASNPQDWRHVPSPLNPADVASRGAMPDDKEAWTLFHQGPSFLRRPESEWPPLPTRQPEAMVGALTTPQDQQESGVESIFDGILRRKSNFQSAKRILCYVFRFIANCKARPHSNPTSLPHSLPSVAELQAVESRIVLDVQRRHFQPEVDALKDANVDPHRVKRVLNRSASVLRQLCPFVDDDGILRVGGRLERDEEPWEVNHPIILPYIDAFTDHVIYDFHVSNAHAGVEFVLCGLRRRFWILRGRQRIKSIIWRCIPCRRVHRRPEQQRMSDLPEFRLTVAEAFTDTAVDLSGPHQVKSGKKPLKVWIVLFVCLRVRAVYFDVVRSLEAQEFIDALQRFHALYPTVKRLVSDCGTNLIGANNVLKKMLHEWKDNTHHHLAPRGISWEFIPPHAPHMGGSWERIVGVMKRTLQHLARTDMPFEKFRTAVCVAAGIVNRRPLTRTSVDSADVSALTPIHFILPAKVITPSSDCLPSEPLSGSALRRSMDTLRPYVDGFWKRFKMDYIAVLQRRQKWINKSRNIQEGDLVLVIDELSPREHWPLAIVTKVHPGEDGLVRRINLRTSARKELERDVRKVVLLEREGEDETVVEAVEGDGDGGGD